MSENGQAIAIVGVSAILPDAPDAATFWDNVRGGRYSITDVSPDRWDPALYYDPDPKAPEKSYSKIGGWVRDWDWDPLGWHLPIPPKVSDAMDDAQKWAVACTRAALVDYGWPERSIDGERTAVILGNAMAGEKHYLTALRISFPEFARELTAAPSFAALPDEVRSAIAEEVHIGLDLALPEVTEDTMPGELGNCMAGRVANLFDFRGPNFITDAACASAMAAMDAAMEGLVEHEFDTVITGGIDRNMGAPTFVKFCKIGALSATGTRPFAEGADGFVMGEGAALFVLKRLADAERHGDDVYAVIRGIGGSSDGRGKGITAPNPVGQRLAVERGWRNAGLPLTSATLVEAHGTSTRVGDVVEVQSLIDVFGAENVDGKKVALGSVKSNIGHLKGGAGAAGVLKATLALRDKVLPPSLNFDRPNPNIDFASSPFAVNTELREWERANGTPRRAGVSAFGFGGTNFHVVLEEYVPGMLDDHARSVAIGAELPAAEPARREPVVAGTAKAPLRGALVLGADDEAELVSRLRTVQADAVAGEAPPPTVPTEKALRARERVAIDYGDAAELADKAQRALGAFESGDPAAWRIIRGRGVFRGRGPAPSVAFLFTGQGSQYVNMVAELREREPIVAETFAEADRVMTPLLGRPLSDYIFVDADDEAAVRQAEEDLRQTEITQPAVLATDLALTRLLGAYGIVPDFVMGHSLGEYGALIAAGALTFDAALEAVSARGREMARVAVDDNGAMAAVLAPLEEVQQLVERIDGYVVVANVNCNSQSVIGGATDAVTRAVAACEEAGYRALQLPVSHAFHTEIVAPASEPLRATLERLRLSPPDIPIVANVDGEFYPMGPDVAPEMLDILARQVASPVQFVKGLETLYRAGAQVFVEVGPKRALQGFVADVLGDRDVSDLFTNHPKTGDVPAFNHALCGLYATGLGTGSEVVEAPAVSAPAAAPAVQEATPPVATAPPAPHQPPVEASTMSPDAYLELGHLFADFLEQGRRVYEGRGGPAAPTEPVVISGASLGTPGTERIFDDENLARLLHGEQLIDVIPARLRQEILDKHVTRLVKRETGEPSFEVIDSADEVIKLAARGGEFDLEREFGVPAERVAALGRATQLAIGAGVDALRDAGIPIVQHYRTTTTGSQLPDRWELPEPLRDDTGVIFASAFPGLEEFAEDADRFGVDRARREHLSDLETMRERVAEGDGDGVALAEIDRRIHELRHELDEHGYQFDRRFIFRILSMGHSQFAELVHARGPNTQVNSACASTTQAVALAEDWIRAGRCRRVVIIASDDATTDEMLGWIGAGFLASGAAATDENVEDAALPFDRRRHGMLLGMGAAGFVVESAEAARERGVRPICEVLGTVTANSAFHGTRLDVDHIGQMMEDVVEQAERRGGVSRHELAPRTLFVSHETYTPARGGSASAEVHALREVFGSDADRVVVANTKGFTGHPMGVGIEDVVAVKAVETGLVPPVANFREVDPELGTLNLSKGGSYPVEYALRLAAGFGSQISMMLLRWTPVPDGRHRAPDELGYEYRIVDPEAWARWLRRISGSEAPALEVAQRWLRVVDAGPGARPAPAALEPVTVPAPEPRPVPAPEPAPAVAEPVGDPVVGRVLELVAEGTGYPPDMLDLDLDLEADLGIDTVKQAEIFAAIREEYGIARDDSLKLRDYPTLQRVVGFVHERAPETVPAPAAAPAPAAEPAPAVAEPVGDPVVGRVLELVAEGTGYPPDMLDLDLDLEADLGIDTVKQAEIFAAIREEYGIARDDSLKLRDYPTLQRVVGFVHERAPETVPAPAAAPAPAAPEVEVAEAGERVSTRRIPMAVPRPPLDWFVPTGVTLEPGARVVVAPDRGGVGAALVKRLEQQGVEVLLVEGAPGADELEARLGDWVASGPIRGVYWLPALDDPSEGIDPAGWHEGLRFRVKLLAVTMRALAEQIGERGTFLVSGTRLGGRHGYDPAGAREPMGGAVTGFTKALGRERPDALVKAVDFEASRKTAALADLLMEETLRDPGAVEIGYADDRRWSVGLREIAAEPDTTRELGSDAVYLVTGAAGSIVAAITADLASASGGTFHLFDLVGEPDPADPDLERYERDRDGLKRELAERIAARGDRPTPVLIDRELARTERSLAALQAIRAVREAGGEARWHQVDLTDPEAVARELESVRESHPRVDVLVHAAGLEISRLLPDKPQSEYDLVFDVKADGWFHLLHGLGDTELGAAVVFSSIAGRFGNGGQTDYSAANDLLCKSVSGFRSSRPGTRGIAIDWTAWRDIGMASRGSIPKMMEAAGIDMLPPAEGIPVVRRELGSAGPGREVVVAGLLGVLLEERDEAGGLDTGSVTGTAKANGPMVERVVGWSLVDGLRVETELDPRTQGFLRDHRIDGTPVLPGVMGIEAFAEIATLAVPGMVIEAMEDVDFEAPCKFYRDEPRVLELSAAPRLDGDQVVADCRLVARRTLASGEEQVTTHFSGRARLAGEPPLLGSESTPADPTGPIATAEDVYRVYFHDETYRVLDRAWRDGDAAVGALAGGLPPNHEPADRSTSMAPRLVELCFQTEGILALGTTGQMALPHHVGRVMVRPGARDDQPCWAIVRGVGDHADAIVVAESGDVLVRLEGYRTIELPASVDDVVLAPLRAAMG